MVYPWTIAEVRERCKRLPRDILILAVLLLASGSSFALGYFSGLEQPHTAQKGEGSGVGGETSSATTTGQFVASKSGTKYYLTTCSGASRISAANKIYFSTEEEAQASGYTRAANCAAK